jgi:aspartate kinase
VYAMIQKEQSIVQKYGGTSVGTTDRIKDVAQRIARQYREGWTKQAIVVSAMTGETNRLVALVQAINPNPPAKAYDMAVASGEQVSVALMVAALAAEGIPAEPFLGQHLGIVTDSFHSKARIRHINREPIDSCWTRGVIPVVAGFQGVTEDLSITTLGRGGSDTSAVALAIAVNAAFCEINTDVDGVFTCDPRVVPEAKLIESMDFETALEMASLGSKVLHPRCVELGAKFSMPIIVRNTFTPDNHRRTKIMSQQQFRADDQHLEEPNVSGVTLDRDVAKITLIGLPQSPRVISGLFTAVAEAGVNVDIIVQNQIESASGSPTTQLGFTTSVGESARAVSAVEHYLAQQTSMAECRILCEKNLAKVSVVGVGMRSHPGVAAATFEALSQNQIAINMVSTSEIKISCVIDGLNADKACQALHRTFITDI